MADTRIWGTLAKKQVEVLREFLNRFIDICPGTLTTKSIQPTRSASQKLKRF